MAIDERKHSKEAQSLRGKLKRSFDSGVDGRTIPGLYFKNLYQRMSISGTVLLTTAATVVGTITGGLYADFAEEAPLDTSISYGLVETADSYQGLGDHVLEYDVDHGTYALFKPRTSEGSIVDYDYLDNTGEALGQLYNIRATLRDLIATHEAGVAFNEDQRNYFFSLMEPTVIHEDQRDTAIRDFDEIISGGLTDSEIVNRARQLLPVIDQIFEQIVDEDEYGFNQEVLDARPDTMSVDEGLGKGAIGGASLMLLYLTGSLFLRSGLTTATQMRQRREKREKKLSPS